MSRTAYLLSIVNPDLFRSRVGGAIEKMYGVPFHIFLMNGGHLMETDAEIRAAVPGWLEAERLRVFASRVRAGAIP